MADKIDINLVRNQDYITEARAAANKVLDGILALEALQTEWNALDYGTTLQDGEGINVGCTVAEVGAVVFDTANALRGLLDAGHATNLARLR